MSFANRVKSRRDTLGLTKNDIPQMSPLIITNSVIGGVISKTVLSV
ncbi:hypothetical protein ACBQ20_03780 [Proteus vulgaris]